MPSRRDITTSELTERAIHRRAVEAVIWGMPIVNFDLMYQAAIGLKATFNQIVYWSRLSDWKNQTLTPNPNAVYLMPFFNTKDVGAVVLEIPPADEGSITGNVDDAWQIALEDVGSAGIDKGEGGKYLILSPRFQDERPAGYIPLPSRTYSGFGLLRSILRGGGDADLANAVAYGKRVRLYPLSQAGNPPPTKFIDASDAVFDSTIPYDVRFFQSLARMVQSEPWMERDGAMIDQLKSIGIEKGKPFNPDAKTQEILSDAAQEAHAFLDMTYQNAYSPSFFKGSSWALPVWPEVVEGQSTGYATPDVYPVDGRGASYSMAFIGVKHLGAGQYYLMTMKDKQGRPLKGNNHYRLHVPANVPVKQYWSVTAYDRNTHALIRNMPRASRSSLNPDLKKNADGSVELYFGPKEPDGNESNFVPTDPNKSFELLLRLYGPEKALFDKTWQLPDVEQTATGEAQKTA
jgi:hypothetical protein